jgi:hypothetical protein
MDAVEVPSHVGVTVYWERDCCFFLDPNNPAIDLKTTYL